MQSLFPDKIVDPFHLAAKVLAIRSNGQTIVTLNGSFDLLHAGHLYILTEAKKQGDCLIVALNSDTSIKAYKNIDRPYIPLIYRLEMLAALACVDYVTWFEETDPRTLLAAIQPDVHVTGVEYGANCVEAETVLRYGGRLHLVDRIPGLATSALIKKIVAVETACASSRH